MIAKSSSVAGRGVGIAGRAPTMAAVSPSRTMLSVLAFFIWGTGVIKDFALAMIVGIIAGTYSSIYVAAPLTEWIDARMAKPDDVKKRLTAEARA